MAQKPSIPKGTRDFSPIEMFRRDYIFETVRSVFRLYGYSPIETPAMENLTTLLGKYGDEGDRLLFKVLNSGNPFSDISPQMYGNSGAISGLVCEKGLRYDLTVPFARFVVQHQNELTFPFKRYQIQPVWRADRPQKGRYREFFQCDVDVIGSKSLLNELELIQIVNDVFSRLNIEVEIRINNRKVLAAIAEVAGSPGKLTDITVAIDKIDKIGLDQVKKELREKELDERAIEVIEPVLLLEGSTSDKISVLRDLFKNSTLGITGLNELQELFSLATSAGVPDNLILDLSLARGLNYYTGAIFEVKAKSVEMGSICGGGRYDDLTGVFGLPDMPGVGISFGADRIYDVLMALDRFPSGGASPTKVLLSNLGVRSIEYLLPYANHLRKEGISCEIFSSEAKLRKQFEYAQKKSIPFIVIAGEDEISSGNVNLKNINTGSQVTMSVNELVMYISRNDS